METNKQWITSTSEMLRSLLADEAKNKHMIADMESTIRQLKAKSAFRLALINSLIENNQKTNEKENK